MRFDCGPTWREACASRQQWHPWFAWHPVRVEGSHVCVWLERVERRGTPAYDGWAYEYRLPTNAAGEQKP